MKNFMIRMKEKMIGSQLDFRVKLFNVMALGGAWMSFSTSIQSVLTQRWSTLVVSVIMMFISIALLIFAIKTGRYQICYNITIIVIFFIFFPILFFQSGGYRSGVPAVFIFAVLFTVLMLEGKKAIFISALELIDYAALCMIAYNHPEMVIQYANEKDIVIDIIFSFTAIGLICGIVLFSHIKEYSHQRDLLQEQNKKLQYYDEVKSTFLTTVAHEIKNPLNIIGLYAQDTYELLDENPIDFEQIRENQKIIEDTVMRLDRIVLDLMDTVSIEQGRLKLSIAPMDMVELIEEAVKFWKEKDKKEILAGNEIIIDIKMKSAPIMADYTRIFQVLINLLSNSSRHTKNGTITVSLKKIGKEQLISVTDTGEGMSADIRKNAFKGYVSTNKDYWRHGMGLYVCHQIIEAHQGNIWIDSKQGKGTRISFTLPEKGV